MSLGVDGPIGDLSAFAISRAFRVASTATNRKVAQCKGCGAGMQRGEGREVEVEGVRRGQRTYPYFCPACFKVIWQANRQFPTLDLEKLTALEHGDQQDTARPSEADLDRMIREREEHQHVRREGKR